MRLGCDLYEMNAVSLAPKLLGKLLCRSINGEIIKVRISETEAYFGENDTACHAHKGKTNRTEIMFYKGGFTYIYLCYGIHYMLNIVSGKQGHPEAVLIRAALPLKDYDFFKIKDLAGPGKLTKALNIDKNLNKENLLTSSKIWLEDDGYEPLYAKDKRIGISYASEQDQNKLWRFILK